MEQPSKPAAEERHDARRHISPQLDQAVRRGAGRTTSPNTTAPMSPIHYTSTRCSCLWTGPNPLWTPASRWRFTSTQAKLQKPCWTPRQHDTKPQTSQKKTQHRSGPDKHRSCSSQWSNCPDCSSGPTRVIKGSSSTVSSTKPQVTRAVHNHKASDRSSPPSSKTSVFTAPTCTQCEYANVQQTGRNHMLVKVKKESNSKQSSWFQMHRWMWRVSVWNMDFQADDRLSVQSFNLQLRQTDVNVVLRCQQQRSVTVLPKHVDIHILHACHQCDTTRCR